MIILKINKIEKGDFWRFFSSNEIFSHNLNMYKSSKVCSISAANLPSDYITQILLNFCHQFAVRFCPQVLLDFCCQSAVLLCEQVLSTEQKQNGTAIDVSWHFLTKSAASLSTFC